MRVFRVICKTDSSYVQALLNVTQDTTLFQTDGHRIIDIPDLEAYRTGLSHLRKALKPRVCFLRYIWVDGTFILKNSFRGDCSSYKFINHNFTEGTTSGILEMIDGGHRRKGAGINVLIGGINFYGQYRVRFKETLKVEYLYLKTQVEVSDILSKNPLPDDFYQSGYDRERLRESLRVILRTMINPE